MLFDDIYFYLLVKEKASAVDAYCATLFICLKDHACPVTITRVESSHRESVMDAARQKGYDIGYFQSDESCSGTLKPVQLVLTKYIHHQVHQEVLKGLESIKFCNFNYNLVDLFHNSGETFFVKNIL